MKTHELKCWPEYFEPVYSGKKRFELRFNDRDYKAGDYLLLREWRPVEEAYTGRELKVIVTYVMAEDDGPAEVMPGWVVMSIQPVPAGVGV